MARLLRLVLPGHAHWVIQRGQRARAVFTDQNDRDSFMAALREAAAATSVQVLAWALLDHEVQLLLVPPTATALSQLVQSVGRRYVSTYNRRHAGAGTLWDGRFRAAAVEPGVALLGVMVAIDGLASAHTSLAPRLGATGDPLLTDPPEFWVLGNTPFDREAAYRRCVADGVPAAQLARWRQAALGGWPIAMDTAAGFAAALMPGRPLRPRAAGRPARAARR